MANRSGGGFWSSIGFADDPDRVIVGQLPVVERTTPETGRDRLRAMFSLDQYGYQSKEVVFVTQAAFGSFLGGALFGSVIQSRSTFINFMENNQATKFQNQLEAKRELQRQMYLAFGKGAWYWGSRVGLFSTSFVTVTTIVSVYRGRESLLEYVAAGGLTGAMFKLSLGPKGAVAGCIVGSVMGGITGAASLLLLKLSGLTMADIRNFGKELKIMREEALKKKAMESMMDKDKDFAPISELEDSLLDNLETDVTDEKPK